MGERIRAQRFVKRVRRGRTCRWCKKLVKAAHLAGEGRTLSELVYSPGVSVGRLKEEIRERGWQCRACLGSPWVYDKLSKTYPRFQSKVLPYDKEKGDRILREQLVKLDQIKADREAERESGSKTTSHHHQGVDDAATQD